MATVVLGSTCEEEEEEEKEQLMKKYVAQCNKLLLNMTPEKIRVPIAWESCRSKVINILVI